MFQQKCDLPGTWVRGVGSYWEGYGFNEPGQAFGWDGSTNGGVYPNNAGTVPFGVNQPCARDMPGDYGGGGGGA